VSLRIVDDEGNSVLDIQDAAALYAAIARGRKILFNLLDTIPYAVLDDYMVTRYGGHKDKEAQ